MKIKMRVVSCQGLAELALGKYNSVRYTQDRNRFGHNGGEEKITTLAADQQSSQCRP
jgi:hypothetical protein